MPHALLTGRVSDASPPRLELRLARGRVRIGLSRARLEGGIALLDLELEVHGAPAAFDPGGGTSQFRTLPCSLVRLEVATLSGETLPGKDSIADLLTAALASSGWPIPSSAGLRHAARSDGGVHRGLWQRPGAEALDLLEAASDARARGEPDAALRLALAGQAALAAGLPVEGEGAIRAALDLGLGRDEARDAWAALVAIARQHADPAGERLALAGLVPASPTGQRPALLLRLSELALSQDDVSAARTHAEEARTLAPRDLATTEACLAIARQVGDGPAVIGLLDGLAALDSAGAGDRLLERARLLADAGRFAEADAGFREALTRLPPEISLAAEHAAFRRAAPPPLGRLPWGEPLETFAGRAPDAAFAARAWRDAALLAREQGDRASALRAARQAHERSGDLLFVGEMLADLLHSGGSVGEALALHEALLAPGQSSLDPGAAADRLAALAELAEESGDAALSVKSLDRLLELRPHDAEVMAWRFRVDPDRTRALERLGGDAERLHSRRCRARLLTLAAEAARTEARDPGRAREFLRQAQESAAGLPTTELEVALARLSSARAASAETSSGLDDAASDAASEELGGALLATASLLGAAGDAAGAAAAREEALEVARRVARTLLAAGNGRAAEQPLRRLLELDPQDADAESELDRLLAETGRFAELGRTLLDRTARETDPDARASLRLRAAEVLCDAGDDETRALAIPALLAVLAEPPPERASLFEAARQLSAMGHGLEAAPYLLAFCRSDPFDGAAARAIEAALATDPRARAEAFVEIADAAPPGPVRAEHLRAAAAGFAEAGDAARLRELTLASFEAWPVDDLAFRGALSDAGGDVDATDAILALRAAHVPAETAACHRTRADLLLSAGRPGPAARAYESCLECDPSDAGAIAGLAEARAAETGPGKDPSIADLLLPLLASARALAGKGELGAAYARLKLAREIDSADLELTLGLARVAEKLGHLDEAVSLVESYADAVSTSNPAAAAARYRELAATARERLSDDGRAGSLLEKAAALDPADPATAAALSSLRGGRRDRALDLLATRLAALQERPGDAGTARAVAILSRELSPGEEHGNDRASRAERSVVANALFRFVERIGPAQGPLDLAFGLDAGVRARIAPPGADGPTARLLSLLAPYLEPLFPVDLARHGVAPSDRLSTASAPALHGALESATRAISGRPLALFRSPRPGLHAALENTRPPSLVLAGGVESLPPGAIAFLTARSVALAGAGWPLSGKFAPRDLLTLCELAARFAGGDPPPLGLPAERAGAFLSALDRSVPPSMRDFLSGLGPASAAELRSLDPVAFASALEQTANRVALLHAGDLHGALTVLAGLQRPGVALASDPAAALERADLADLARFALSDPYLVLRGLLLGWP